MSICLLDIFLLLQLTKTLVLNSTRTIYMSGYTSTHFVVDDKL